MTPHLDYALRRWRLYKRLMIFFAAVNAFSISAALVIGIRYFGANPTATQKELIATGILTLIFGIVLPMSVMALMARAINTLRHEIQGSVLDFLRNWRKTEQDYSGDAPAFKNPEFWLQIALLSGQFFGQVSVNPAVQVAGEIAFTIRQELQRAQKNDIRQG